MQTIQSVEQQDYQQNPYLTNDEDRAAQSEGWGLFNADGKLQIQKIDEMNTFEYDKNAHRFVKLAALSGSALHVKVKEILRVQNPEEHRLIFE